MPSNPTQAGQTLADRALRFVDEFQGDDRCSLNRVYSEALAEEVRRLRAALTSPVATPDHAALLALVKEASEIMTITYAGNFPAGIESFLVRAAAAIAALSTGQPEREQEGDVAWRHRWHARLGRGETEPEGRFYTRIEAALTSPVTGEPGGSQR